MAQVSGRIETMGRKTPKKKTTDVFVRRYQRTGGKRLETAQDLESWHKLKEAYLRG